MEENDTPQFILPASALLAAAKLDIEQEVLDSLNNALAPLACPDSHLYVPEPLRPRVLQWCHTNNFSCHPGITRRIHLCLS